MCSGGVIPPDVSSAAVTSATDHVDQVEGYGLPGVVGLPGFGCVVGGEVFDGSAVTAPGLFAACAGGDLPPLAFVSAVAAALGWLRLVLRAPGGAGDGFPASEAGAAEATHWGTHCLGPRD